MYSGLYRRDQSVNFRTLHFQTTSLDSATSLSDSRGVGGVSFARAHVRVTSLALVNVTENTLVRSSDTFVHGRRERDRRR